MKTLESNIKKGYLFQFFMSLHFIAGILVPFFMDWGGISFFKVTLIQSWFLICAFLLEIPTGAVADRFGRKTSVILAAFFNCLAVVIYTSKPDFWIFLIGEFFWALAMTLMSGAYEALIYDSLKLSGKENQSKKVFGRYSTFKMAGFLVAGPSGSAIADYLGLKWGMLSMIIPFTIAFLIALTFKEPIDGTKVKKTGYLQNIQEGLIYLYRHRQLKILALDGVVVHIFCFLLIWIYQLVLKKLGIDLVYFGAIHALIVISEIIIMNNFENLEKIAGSKSRYLFLSAVLPALGFVALGISEQITPSIIAMCVIGGFGITRFILVSSYLQKHIQSHNRATTNSAIAMFKQLGSAVLYPLVGLLAEFSLSFLLIGLGVIIIIFAAFSKVEETSLID